MTIVPNIHEVAALLAAEGVRVMQVTSHKAEYLFYGHPAVCDVATFDNDFHVKMQQLPRVVAALIEQYLRGVRVSV
jgi:hypothetical protein